MSTVTDGDDLSPEFDENENCPGGLCGRIDYEFLFQQNQKKADEKIDDEMSFHLELLKAEDSIHRGNLAVGLYLYKEAYERAWETEALGIDGAFAVMYHVHYFHFYEDALRMCTEITETAFRTRDVSILRDIWRLLPEIGNGTQVHEQALILRDDIETRHPEVMTYIEKSGRL